MLLLSVLYLRAIDIYLFLKRLWFSLNAPTSYFGEYPQSRPGSSLVYDARLMELNFDIVWYLKCLDIELSVKETALPGLSVWLLITGEQYKNRQLFIENVFKPLVPLLNTIASIDFMVASPSSVSESLRHIFLPFLSYSTSHNYLTRRFIDRYGFHRTGLSRFSLPSYQQNSFTRISITIRNMDHQPERNTSPQWISVVNSYVGKDVCFLLIPDGNNPEVIPGIERIDPLHFEQHSIQIIGSASTNLQERLRVYMSCDMNITTSNGPNVLMHLSSIPYITYLKSSKNNFQTSDLGHMLRYGILFGESFRFATRNQKLIWHQEDDKSLKQCIDQVYFEKSRV